MTYFIFYNIPDPIKSITFPSYQRLIMYHQTGTVMNSILEQVQNFAAKAHHQQKRKYSGEKFIEHPIRVMKITQKYTDNICVHAAALLHDVLEDTQVKPEEMQSFLNNVMPSNEAKLTFELVEDLTDVYTKEDYPQHNRKKRKLLEAKRLEKSHPLSQTVKYADLIDNTLDIVKNDKDFAKIFVFECSQLLEHIDRGDQQLYKVAKKTTEDCWEEVKNHFKNHAH